MIKSPFWEGSSLDRPFIYQLLRFLLVLFIIICLYFLGKYLLFLFYPFLFAGILSYLIQPVVIFLEKKLSMSRMFATIVVVLFGFLFIISFITFLITELIQGSLYLAEELPKYVRHLVHMFNDLFQTRVLPIYQKLLTFLQTLNLESPKKEYDFLTEFQHNLTLSGMEFLQTLFLKIASLLSMLPYSLTVTI